MKTIIIFLFTIIIFSSCTENSRAKNWGGTQDITLQKNEVLMNVTWKDNEMWLCTKDTITGTIYFREKSSWGIMEGLVRIKSPK